MSTKKTSFAKRPPPVDSIIAKGAKPDKRHLHKFNLEVQNRFLPGENQRPKSVAKAKTVHFEQSTPNFSGSSSDDTFPGFPGRTGSGSLVASSRYQPRSLFKTLDDRVAKKYQSWARASFTRFIYLVMFTSFTVTVCVIFIRMHLGEIDEYQPIPENCTFRLVDCASTDNSTFQQSATTWSASDTADFQATNPVVGSTANTSADTANGPTRALMSSTAATDDPDNYTMCHNDTIAQMNLSMDCLNEQLQSVGPAQVMPSTFSTSIFYVMTLFTTIGYGNVAATGNLCWLFAMVSALCGVPLFFAFLADIAECIQYRMSKVQKRLQQCVVDSKKRRLCKCTKMDSCPDCIPYLFMVILSTLYLVVVSGMFYSFQHFDSYVTTLYFVLQSAALIGFGDVTPTMSDYYALYVIFVMLGVVLVYMTFFVQQQWTLKAFEELTRLLTKKKKIAIPAMASIMPPSKTPQPKAVPAPQRPPEIPPALSTPGLLSGPGSLYTKPFSVNKLGLGAEEDDDSDMDDLYTMAT